MSDLLLIHGSCHGAWCWDRLIATLSERGIAARAIDLPGRDGDGAVTLADQAGAILRAARSGTVLLGHSAAGFPMTAAAEAEPTRFAGLIYLCAYLPAAGQSLADMRRAGPSQPLLPAIRVSADRQSFTFDPEAALGLLYHDCPADLARSAAGHLCHEPIAPQETRLTLKASLNLPRHYIRCDNDRAIPPGYQRQMAANLPPEAISALPSGHSPFLSMPGQLADRIADVLRGWAALAPTDRSIGPA